MLGTRVTKDGNIVHRYQVKISGKWVGCSYWPREDMVPASSIDEYKMLTDEEMLSGCWK